MDEKTTLAMAKLMQKCCEINHQHCPYDKCIFKKIKEHIEGE